MQSRRVCARDRGMFEHTLSGRCWKLDVPRISQELSTEHLRGVWGIEPKRKKSWLLVSRSMMSIGPAQTGQRDWVVIWGSFAQVALPSRRQQRERASPRLRLAKSPK